MTKEQAVWQVSECRSFTDNRFYVDWVRGQGWLELVAENLTREHAEKLVNEHNAELLITGSCKTIKAAVLAEFKRQEAPRFTPLGWPF